MANKPTQFAGELVTTNYGWVKPTVGASADAWGGYINADLDGIDSTVHGMLPLAGGTLTGALTPSQTAGIVGTTTNNNANAGAVGAYVEANQMTNVAFTSNVAKNILSFSLTAGDWDVEGMGYAASSGSLLTAVVFSLSTVSNTLSAAASWLGGATLSTSATAAFNSWQTPTGSLRVSLAATTTVYLVAELTFASGTGNCQGSIRARRMR